jgi:hypothetical protein
LANGRLLTKMIQLWKLDAPKRCFCAHFPAAATDQAVPPLWGCPSLLKGIAS